MFVVSFRDRKRSSYCAVLSALLTNEDLSGQQLSARMLQEYASHTSPSAVDDSEKDKSFVVGSKKEKRDSNRKRRARSRRSICIAISLAMSRLTAESKSSSRKNGGRNDDDTDKKCSQCLKLLKRTGRFPHGIAPIPTPVLPHSW